MRYAIYGIGGFGREVATFILSQNRPESGGVIFVDDASGSQDVMGCEVLQFAQILKTDRVVIAVGDGAVRQRLEQKCLAAGHQLESIASKTAIIAGDAIIGEGAVFSDYTMVTAQATIGRQFQCNVYSYVAHDCLIGDYVTFGPRVACNGNVTIGDYAYIGAGALLRQGVVIGAHATVGMGAVVVKDVAEGETVMGNPAKARPTVI
jgi:sugar O-acyltransferase (sialic acid O-acetyltransferase NeuD family)